MHIDFPYHIDDSGATADTEDQDYIYDLIEQVLFTQRGERVNRPDFGCGVDQLVFEPNSIELSSAIQTTIHSDLQRWLSEVLQVQSVRVAPIDARLAIDVDFQPLAPEPRKSISFERGRSL
jgi:uncharacterized protein